MGEIERKFHLIDDSSSCAPDDGRRNRLKHVKQFIEIDREKVASFWLYFRDILAKHGRMNVKKRKLFLAVSK